ncbi:glycosyl hydrolase family 28 protein [Paenibacillus riograndensis]|uniref:Parallel beta-helix repeat-containing protein n=1 Tax=Paenibacillus riograndensis SBR5 TaxID=1073571 RepID=A0A0E4HCG0_9BACL|nr:glycosyl hydrolase family 28 protein [Paenibacillus riograndensis]CQR56347.1 Parallel beta-helix repeat-containing protein [Paenibacillus riograndensis SBR5]
MNQLQVYEAPNHIPGREDYQVKVRTAGGGWQPLFVYEVKVDMHEVRPASMALFDMEGEAEVEIICLYTEIENVNISPASRSVECSHDRHKISFRLNGPQKLSVEINGGRFRNLHLFANPMEVGAPQPDGAGVHLVQPGIHRSPDLLALMKRTEDQGTGLPQTLYFAPGTHYIEETVFAVPSGTVIYLAGGAAFVGSLSCDRVEDVEIRGRGVVYLAEFHRFSAFRGVRIVFSRRIRVEGITVIDPPHYSIFIGQSTDIAVTNFKSFSTRGWSDGIDIMSSSEVAIRDVFMRNSDDCIAIYGSRWDYFGDSRNISVRDSVLWADVAHPLMIGTHGDYRRGGDIIENIVYENIDILEHHEPQENYWGALAINAGDGNTVRNVLYSNIRVERIEQGQLFDLRVVMNKDYNPEPGKGIEKVTFRNVSFNGGGVHPSRIYGYDEDRGVNGVEFINLQIGGEWVENTRTDLILLNAYAHNVVFKRE